MWHTFRSMKRNATVRKVCFNLFEKLPFTVLNVELVYITEFSGDPIIIS